MWQASQSTMISITRQVRECSSQARVLLIVAWILSKSSVHPWAELSLRLSWKIYSLRWKVEFWTNGNRETIIKLLMLEGEVQGLTHRWIQMEKWCLRLSTVLRSHREMRGKGLKVITREGNRLKSDPLLGIGSKTSQRDLLLTTKGRFSAQGKSQS